MKSPYFKKIIMAFSVIIIIYAGIMSVIYVYTRDKLSRAENEKQAEIFLEQAAERIDAQLEIALNLREQLKRNENMIQFADNRKINYYNVLRVYKQLSDHLDAFSKLGYMISVSKPEHRMMIAPQYTVDLERYLRDNLKVSEIPDEIQELSMGKISRNRQSYVLPTEADGQVLMYVTREEVGSQSNPLLFYLWFNRKNLLPRFEEESERSFYVVVDDQILLADNTGRQAQFLQEYLQKEKQPLGEMQKKKVKDYRILTRKSNVKEMDWDYVYITDTGEYTKSLKKFLQDAFWMIVALLSGGFGLAFFLSKNIYRPVHEVVQSLDEHKDGKQVGNELEFILNRTKEMQASAKKFEETIAGNKEKLKIQFLRELTLGLVPRQQLNDQLHSRILGDPSAAATVVVLRYNLKEELSKTITAEGNFALKKQILSWLFQVLSEDIQCEMFEYDYNRAVLLIPDCRQTEIVEKMSTMISQAEEIFQTRICAIVGEQVNSLEEIPASFHSALNLMEYEFLWDNYTVVTSDRICGIKNETYYYPLDIEKNLIDAVLQGRKEEAHGILASVLEHNFEKKQLSPETLSKFIFAMVSTSNRILHRFGNSAELDKEKELSYIKLKMYHNQNELKQAIYELFEDLLKQSEEESAQRGVDIVDEMIRYLHANYHLDLSLNDIAEQFHLSAGYVGILFKKSTGENFKDYFNQYKVEKAKQILQQENIKIKDLAERIGCNSTSSFIRIFKKYTGISPGQYAESLHLSSKEMDH